MAAMVIRPVFLHECLKVAYARMKEGGSKASLYIKVGFKTSGTSQLPQKPYRITPPAPGQNQNACKSRCIAGKNKEKEKAGEL